MVLGSFGFEVTEEELRELCDCTLSGTDALKALDAARQLGFTETTKHNLDAEALRSLLEDGCFPIAYVNLFPIDGTYERHAMVVVGMDEAFVTVYDPERGKCKLPLETFSAAWRIQRNLAILVSR